MSKSTITYWNPLLPAEQHRWRWIEGLEGQVQELILSHDPSSGEITRLTRFLPGADTTPFGAKAHTFPEEIFIVSGRLHDAAFGIWLEAGHYASRPPGELHGPFRSDEGCVVLDVSFPQRNEEAHHLPCSGSVDSPRPSASDRNLPTAAP
ncbi:cupin domain-containing protein [Synechococcus sp. Lug-A]|uniref:cupin domain-containing protein n=1 Tax=Synechococcus sp. Lug-A TaxID=2823740 RepID=UPI0020CFC17C|nr:cupin domain-containing protein [Synechococcus sp. Lug-A]MCP9846244.1 cupin domain-containing protein [Synechococcus sp. Lug-A]